jgi:hypothetical protein
MTNDKVRLPQSGRFVTGLTSVFNHINPAVSNFGRQTPPEGIGVDAFEFWCPKRRPEGKNFALRFTPGLAAFGAGSDGGIKGALTKESLADFSWKVALGDKRLTEEELKASGEYYNLVKIPMTYSGRFVAENETGNGLCKLLTNVNGQIIGCHLVGNPASEIIVIAGIAVEHGYTVDEFKKTVFPHPTVGEAIHESLYL